MFRTPIQLLSEKPNRIFIKREDLLPSCFGGNKYRIAKTFIKDMFVQNKDCIIAYGNPRSNLCRVLSMLCYSRNIPCFIISPDEGDGNRVCSYNNVLSEIAQANIIQCDKRNVSDCVERVICNCERKGLHPYYIYGDIYGKGNERVPVESYFNVYKNELADFILKESINYIFLPLGTGMTMAGLTIASKMLNGKEQIVGISIGREREKANNSFRLYCESYLDSFNMSADVSNAVIVDDYLMGGYGKYSHDLETMITSVYCKYGLAMDPTYVGKAFFGMTDWIEKNQIRDSNILFIHTGGLPIWFDFINTLRGNELC